MKDLSKSIQFYKGVGEKRAELFNKLGLFCGADILHHYPRRYEDWSDIKKISEAPSEYPSCIKVLITSPVIEKRLNRGRSVFNTFGTDGVSEIRITIWGNKYSASRLKEGETFLLYGRVIHNLFGYTVESPDIKKATDKDIKIHPVYRTVSGLSCKTIEAVAEQVVAECKSSDLFSEYLSPDILKKYSLMPLNEALCKIHFPENFAQASLARNRLAFDELLILFIMLGLIKESRKGDNNGIVINSESDEFVNSLPFSLTKAQKEAILQAEKDMSCGKTMNRLLQGDVGSGKTAVAAALIFNTAKSGYQSALMAPTDILASQHFKTLSDFLNPFGIKTALIKGKSTAKEKREIKEALQDGKIDLLIGTHAIFQSSVTFKNLALVITDEQHRFGVEQRNKLSEKGENPHLFVMSATPIPRTLALMIYGELDVSILDELPSGRKKINTYLVNSSYHKRVYGYIKKHIAEGRQGYIVCPMVEESDDIPFDLTSATEYFEELKNGEFSNYRLALLHGKMKQKEKDAVMDSFASGDIDLLISTTVIEVGIDVPNASVMVIENAERFGLSQLHQLRGRIGRGEFASDCILVSDSSSDIARERLNVIKTSTDGFKIADEDLKLRGAGDFFGSRQSGLPFLKVADLCSNTEIVYNAKSAADDILADDPALSLEKNKLLKEKTEKMFMTAGERIN